MWASLGFKRPGFATRCANHLRRRPVVLNTVLAHRTAFAAAGQIFPHAIPTTHIDEPIPIVKRMGMSDTISCMSPILLPVPPYLRLERLSDGLVPVADWTSLFCSVSFLHPKYPSASIRTACNMAIPSRNVGKLLVKSRPLLLPTYLRRHELSLCSAVSLLPDCSELRFEDHQFAA